MDLRLDAMTFFQTIMQFPYDQLFSYGFVCKGRFARADEDRGRLIPSNKRRRGGALPVTSGFQRAATEVIATRELFVRASRRTASETCSICLNNFARSKFVFKLSCDHLFHRGCIEPWAVIGARTCPVCRHPFTLPFEVDT